MTGVITDRYVIALLEAQDRSQLDEHGAYIVGKFQNQTPLCAALYQLADDGYADVQSGHNLTGFRLHEDEARELGVKPFLILTEDSHGFVSLREFAELETYERILGTPQAGLGSPQSV